MVITSCCFKQDFCVLCQTQSQFLSSIDSYSFRIHHEHVHADIIRVDIWAARWVVWDDRAPPAAGVHATHQRRCAAKGRSIILAKDYFPMFSAFSAAYCCRLFRVCALSQCEQCSGWFHGLCVGFREETAVPDRWFCNPCIGQPHLTAPNPGTVAAPAARATASARGRGSSGRNRVRGRGHGRGQPSGRQDRAPPLASAQVQGRGAARGRGQVSEQHESDNGSRASSRAAVDGRRATSTPEPEETAVSLLNAPQQTPASPTPSAPPVQAQSTPSPSPAVSAAPQGRGRPRGSTVETAVALSAAPQQAPASPTPPTPPAQARSTLSPLPAVAAAPPSGRDRPRGSTVETAVPLSAAPQQAPASPAPPAPPVQVQSAPSLSPAVAAAPPRGRGRQRGSRNALPSAKPSASPVSAPAQATLAPASPPSVPPSVLPPDRYQEQQQSLLLSIADQSRTGDGVGQGESQI